MKAEIKEADYIINCLPLLKELGVVYTKDIIDSMKKTCVFVNIGRGSTVDEEYLFKALKENKLRGAALDVFFYNFIKNRLSIIFIKFIIHII